MSKKDLKMSLMCSIVFVAFIGLYSAFVTFINQNEVAADSVSVEENYEYCKYPTNNLGHRGCDSLSGYHNVRLC